MSAAPTDEDLEKALEIMANDPRAFDIGELALHVAEAIAQARQDERERCARIADDVARQFKADGDAAPMSTARDLYMGSSAARACARCIRESDG